MGLFSVILLPLKCSGAAIGKILSHSSVHKANSMITQMLRYQISIAICAAMHLLSSNTCNDQTNLKGVQYRYRRCTPLFKSVEDYD